MEKFILAEVKIEAIGMGLVTHNYPCPIWFTSEKAVYANPDGHFLPSWRAQKEGWRIIKCDSWIKKQIFKMVFEK